MDQVIEKLQNADTIMEVTDQIGRASCRERV